MEGSELGNEFGRFLASAKEHIAQIDTLVEQQKWGEVAVSAQKAAIDLSSAGYDAGLLRLIYEKDR